MSVRLVTAYLLLGGAHAAGDYNFYDHTWPTGMYLTWKSSRGMSGEIEYQPSTSGTAVADEGNGGTTRRAVLAPGNADCKPFESSATTDYRGQIPG
jgi:hypothetical protein